MSKILYEMEPAMEALTILPARHYDEERILKFLLADFAERESITAAFEMTSNECVAFFRSLIREGLRSGSSVILLNPRRMVVGVRLSMYRERDREQLNGRHSSTANLAFSAKARCILRFLGELSASKWDLMPEDIGKVLQIIIISIHTAYSGLGLAKRLLTFDVCKQYRAGVHALLAEATAIASQMLFARLGFSVLHEIAHDEFVDGDGSQIFRCKDGTTRGQLVFKRI